jgi:hypothetical protein
MKRRTLIKGALTGILCTLVSVRGISQTDTTTRIWGNWQTWGDQGNGTYHNPVLPGDYSDIDCIRVGADYYAVS